MDIIRKLKKGQGLPLNTIVIAILVIIVLLVIIVFFTTRIGTTQGQLDDTQAGFQQCSVGSYLIPADRYSDARPTEENECSEGQVRIYGVTGLGSEQICCATPTS